MADDPRIKNEVRKIVQWLVECDYDAIVNYTNGHRLPAKEIRFAIEDYGRKLVMVPENQFENLDVIEVTKACPREWSVRCPLWTLEEGRSDLTLEMSIIDTSQEELRTEIDNVIIL